MPPGIHRSVDRERNISSTLKLGVEIQFVKPTYLGDVLQLEATVEERLESRQVVLLQFRFMRDKTMVAKGRVSIMLCNV